MNTIVQTYSPEDVVFTICDYKIQDWDEIRITPSEPSFKRIKGINGKGTRVRCTSKNSATIDFSILQTSEANNVLTEIHRQDMMYGTGRLEVSIKDLSGQTHITSFEAYLESAPILTFKDSVELIEWTLICESLESMNTGGNASLTEVVLKKISEKIKNIF